MNATTETQGILQDGITPQMADAHNVLDVAAPTCDGEQPQEVEKVYVQTEDLVSGTPVN